MMGANQELAFQLVKKNSKIHQEILKIHHGRLIKELGDGVLCFFSNSQDAVAAAYELQKHYFESKEISLRIGIHYGEVILDNHDVFGDAVNIASRLQTLGSPGSVFFSKKIHEDIDENSSLKSVSLGKFSLKNVKEPMEVFALTNEGLTVPKRGVLLKLMESRLKKVMVGGLVVLTLTLVGFGIYHNTSISKLMAKQEKSIAILPFSEIEYPTLNDSLNITLTDNLLNGLSSISSIGIIDPRSSNQYNINNQSAKTISNELKAEYLLVGNISGNGTKRKVNIRLFEGKSDKVLWSENFEIGSEMLSILEFNRQVILQISSLLGVKLTVSEIEKLNSNPTDNSDAYQAYISGRRKYLKYEEKENQQAIKLFRKALSLSPNFKEAYQGLADAFVQHHYYNEGEKYWLDSSIYYSNKTLQIDSAYSDAYVSLGSANYYKIEYLTAKNYFKKAVSINDNNSRALANLGSTLLVLGKIDSSLFYVDKSSKLNPQLYLSLLTVGWNYRLLKDYQNAICWLEESIKIKPSIEGYEQLAYSLIGLNELNEAKGIVTKIMNLEEEESLKRLSAGKIYFFCRDFEAAYLNLNLAFQSDQNSINCGINRPIMYLGYLEKIIKENKFKSELLIDGCKEYLVSNIKNNSQDPDDYFDMVKYYAMKGDLSNCLKSLEIAEKNNWVDIFFITQNPIFDGFKNEPDFIKAVKNQNLKVDLKRKNTKYMNTINEEQGKSTLAICYK